MGRRFVARRLGQRCRENSEAVQANCQSGNLDGATPSVGATATYHRGAVGSWTAGQPPRVALGAPISPGDVRSRGRDEVVPLNRAQRLLSIGYDRSWTHYAL